MIKYLNEYNEKNNKMKTLFFIIALLISSTFAIKKNQIKLKYVCENAKQYTVTAWAAGSVVKYDGKCYRARTVGAAGHQTPWDNSTYDSISGWDEIKSEKNKCSEIHSKCIKCSNDKCTEYSEDFEPNCYSNLPCKYLHFKCVTCENNRCVKCKDGWELFKEGCKRKIECQDYDKNCQTCNEDECLSCKNGFSLNSEISKCTKSQDKCKDVSDWSREIAFGQKDPWTYKTGQVVKYEGKKYKANWGGQETPGSKKCQNESDCKNQGIQWVLVEDC